MFVATCILVVSCSLIAPSDAWGKLFNRFTPEMLSNLGGYGGGSSFRAQPFLQNPSEIDFFRELQESELEDKAVEPCYGKRCTTNEHCCPGSVCVYVDGVEGTCLFVYGLRQGEFCRRDNDCETGLVCIDSDEGRTCQPAITSRKQYSEDCIMSSECDIRKGLCCQFQRRHRQAPRKVCSYFKDPLICIGPVASDEVEMVNLERTTGEKRLTGKMVGPYSHLQR